MRDEQEFYGTDYREDVHKSIHDAIDGIYDSQFPARVTVFRRMTPDPKRLATHVLDFVLEHIDESLAAPEGGVMPKTPAMIELAKHFAEEICKLSVPWACEPTKVSFWVDKEGEIVKEEK